MKSVLTINIALLLLAGCQTTDPGVAQASRLCTVQANEVFLTVADTSTSQPSTTPTSRSAYTAPRAPFQSMEFIATALSAAALGRTTAGKEAAEAGVAAGQSGLTGITGAPGLAAPQARTLEAVVGQPGLQRGFAVGFGLMPSQNIFTRTFNPITGPNGGCQALVSAGFFASPTACRAQIRR